MTIARWESETPVETTSCPQLRMWRRAISSFWGQADSEIVQYEKELYGFKESRDIMNDFVDTPEEAMVNHMSERYWATIADTYADAYEEASVKIRAEERENSLRIVAKMLARRFNVAQERFVSLLSGKTPEELERLTDRSYDYSTFEEFSAALL